MDEYNKIFLREQFCKAIYPEWSNSNPADGILFMAAFARNGNEANAMQAVYLLTKFNTRISVEMEVRTREKVGVLIRNDLLCMGST